MKISSLLSFPSVGSRVFSNFKLFRLSDYLIKIFIMLLAQHVEADVSCENQSECPSYMTQLQMGNSVCTGFLVKNDLVATNLHCLPQELRKEGISCKGKIKFSFPLAGRHSEERVDCDSVQFVSEPLNHGSFNVDLAILKLNKTMDRDYLRFSQDGFKAKQKITIYKFDPTKSGGILKKNICEPKPNSIYNPYFTSEYSPIVNLAPCESIPGNSGSPLISEDGYVRGILHSIADAPFLLEKNISVSGKSEMKMTFGSNMSCVNLSLFSYPRRNYSACDVSVNPENQKKLEDTLRQKALGDALKSLDEKMKTIGQKYKSSEIMLFDWEVQQKKPIDEEMKFSVVGRFLFLPKCVALATAPIGTLRRTLAGNVSSFEIKVPYYKLSSNVNSDLIYTLDLTEEERKIKVTSNLQDWLAAKSIKIRADVISANNKIETFDLNLPECGLR